MSASIGIKTIPDIDIDIDVFLLSMTVSISTCTCTEKKEFENVYYDTNVSTIIVDLSNDEDLSVSEN